jgi:hypothetical protein
MGPITFWCAGFRWISRPQLNLQSGNGNQCHLSNVFEFSFSEVSSMNWIVLMHIINAISLVVLSLMMLQYKSCAQDPVTTH